MKLKPEELILLLTVLLSGEPKETAEIMYKKLKKQVAKLKKEIKNDRPS